MCLEAICVQRLCCWLQCGLGEIQHLDKRLPRCGVPQWSDGTQLYVVAAEIEVQKYSVFLSLGLLCSTAFLLRTALVGKQCPGVNRR